MLLAVLHLYLGRMPAAKRRRQLSVGQIQLCGMAPVLARCLQHLSLEIRCSQWYQQTTERVRVQQSQLSRSRCMYTLIIALCKVMPAGMSAEWLQHSTARPPL